MNIEQLRLETPGVAFKNHLNNAGAALPSQVVVQTLLNGIREEAEIGGYEFAEKYVEDINDFYEVAAQLLNTSPHNIAFTTNATDSYNRALSSISFQVGDIILTTDDDYVSNQLAFMQLGQRNGVKVVRAKCLPTGGVDIASVADLIKKHQPKLVAVTHVPTNSGLIQDVVAIGKLCRANETLYLVDACQSVGQMEVNAVEIGCDFLTATYRKWLRGPRGTGLLYVSNRVLESDLAPHFIDLRGSVWESENEYSLANTAKRFELWEKSYPLMLGAKAAMQYALQIGMPCIETRIKQLADYTRDNLMALKKVEVLDQGQQRCSIVTLHMADANPDQLIAGFAAKDINVSYARKVNALIDFNKKKVDWALRISPHYYNTKAEIDDAIEVLNKWR